MLKNLFTNKKTIPPITKQVNKEEIPFTLKLRALYSNDLAELERSANTYAQSAYAHLIEFKHLTASPHEERLNRNLNMRCQWAAFIIEKVFLDPSPVWGLDHTVSIKILESKSLDDVIEQVNKFASTCHALQLKVDKVYGVPNEWKGRVLYRWY